MDGNQKTWDSRVRDKDFMTHGAAGSLSKHLLSLHPQIPQGGVCVQWTGALNLESLI